MLLNMKFNNRFFIEEKNIWLRRLLYYFTILGFIVYFGIFCQYTGLWKSFTDILTPILEFKFQNKFIEFFYSSFLHLSIGISAIIFPMYIWSLIKKKMKKLLAIIVLGLFLITPSQANDIRDFQIEGISIGDSALEFFSEKEIKKGKQNFYKNKKYTPVNISASFFKTYTHFDFSYKSNDKKYIIKRMSGSIDYRNKDIKNCLKQVDESS